jgi:hypothetical protein
VLVVGLDRQEMKSSKTRIETKSATFCDISIVRPKMNSSKTRIETTVTV